MLFSGLRENVLLMNLLPVILWENMVPKCRMGEGGREEASLGGTYLPQGRSFHFPFGLGDGPEFVGSVSVLMGVTVNVLPVCTAALNPK